MWITSSREPIGFTEVCTLYNDPPMLHSGQTRRFRFKEDCFMRILPGSGQVKETFGYRDVFDITVVDASSIIVRFYSGKETQYIESRKAQEIAELIARRAYLSSGHTFTVKRTN